jgi:hypothetical protein
MISRALVGGLNTIGAAILLVAVTAVGVLLATNFSFATAGQSLGGPSPHCGLCRRDLPRGVPSGAQVANYVAKRVSILPQTETAKHRRSSTAKENQLRTRDRLLLKAPRLLQHLNHSRQQPAAKRWPPQRELARRRQRSRSFLRVAKRHRPLKLLWCRR